MRTRIAKTITMESVDVTAFAITMGDADGDDVSRTTANNANGT